VGIAAFDTAYVIVKIFRAVDTDGYMIYLHRQEMIDMSFKLVSISCDSNGKSLSSYIRNEIIECGMQQRLAAYEMNYRSFPPPIPGYFIDGSRNVIRIEEKSLLAPRAAHRASKVTGSGESKAERCGLIAERSLQSRDI
jgi:hypothetical protein